MHRLPKVKREEEVILSACAVASLVFSLDRITKTILYAKMYEGQSIPILPNLFHITLVFNKGIAFGLFNELSWPFLPFTVLIVGLILSYIIHKKPIGLLTHVSCGLIIGGSAGNLVDRMRLGYVIDFLDFRIWPVFNIADSSIAVGALLLVWRLCIRSS